MSPVAALDVGTTTARAGVFADDGTRLGTAATTMSTSHPFAGAVEQDPSALVDAALAVLERASADAGVAAKDLEGLGIANQRATVVAWDATTRSPIGPALGWQDARTAEACAALRAEGIPLTTSASCSKLQWMVEEDERIAAAARAGTLRLGTVDTWLTFALSGGAVHVTDPSNAGATGLYDLRTGDWSDGALALFGVPREPLAAIVDSDAAVGHTDAALTGAAIEMRGRIGDQQSACVAHGLGAGEAKLTLGTSGMLDLALGDAAADAPAGCYTLPMWRRAGAEAFMIEGSVQTAGAAMEWLARIGVLPSVDRIDALAGPARPGVRVIPALAGLGTPAQDPDARGVIAGLGLDSGPGEIVRGALDGIAHRVADVADTIGVEGELRVDGGLARSDVLLGLIADATGLAVRRAVDIETTLRGAAALAAGATDSAPAPLEAPVEPSRSPGERADARAAHRLVVEVASSRATTANRDER